MGIISFSFLLLVLIVLVIYYILPRQIQNIWLLFASYYFVILWAPEFAITLFLLSILCYYFGLELTSQVKGKNLLLWVGISINLFALIFFRVNHFFLSNLDTLFKSTGINVSTGGLQILIPVGISFYVLQNISYLVDVSKKQITPTKNFIDFALYLSYFPKLLAGPIERARTFLPKLANPRYIDKVIITRSLVLVIIGYLRKVVIADSLIDGIPNRILEESYNYGAFELWSWLIIYAFALYNDFAGYTSIVRGISGLFGIELSPNFNLPYFSRSFSEFWNRWHMTLSQWLRDYIFFPLTRSLMVRIPNRQNLLVIAFPAFITMLVSGLWHGFSWNLLLWGALYGFYLTIERILSLRKTISISEHTIWHQGILILITFVLVIVAWVPFYLELPYALQYLSGLLRWGNYEIVYWRELTVGLLFLIPIISMDFLQWKYKDETFILHWPRLAQAFVYAAILFLIFLGSPLDGGQAFIYQNF